MKRCNKKFKTLCVTITLAILPCVMIFAQAPPSIFSDPDAPIDGGLGFLLAAGVGYGYKKARDQRKKKLSNKDNVI